MLKNLLNGSQTDSDLIERKIIALVKEKAFKSRGMLTSWRQLMKYSERCLSGPISADREKLLNEELIEKRKELESINERTSLLKDDKIPECDQELADVKEEHDKKDTSIPNHVAKRHVWEFKTCIVLLIFLTIYLVLYYLNAFHAVFFRDWSEVSNLDSPLQVLSQTIFDPNIFEHLTGAAFLFLPLAGSILLAGALCLHLSTKMGKPLRWSLLAGLLVFFLDYIIAYRIGSSIFEWKKFIYEQTGMGNDTLAEAEWSIAQSLMSPDVWLVLFCGFVPALMAGFILHWTFKNWSMQDPGREYKNKVARIEEKKAGFQDELDELTK